MQTTKNKTAVFHKTTQHITSILLQFFYAFDCWFQARKGSLIFKNPAANFFILFYVHLPGVVFGNTMSFDMAHLTFYTSFKLLLIYDPDISF